MGLFDNLIKSFSNLTKTEEAQKFKNDLKDFANNINETNNSNSSYNIPSEYSHFPIFEGKIGDLITKKEPKYQRCSINYYNISDENVDNYIRKIEDAGYEKKTDVRYEKNNEYIIVDYKNYLNIVYHIKF